MVFTVKVDTTPFVAARRNFESRQLPFIVAASLTATAKVAQEAVKRNVRSSFHLRNTFTEAGIRIKPAQSNAYPIQADVHTDTANRTTGAKDYLGLQESGGERVPVAGRHHIAVPTGYLRFLAPGAIPNELRPKNLLGAAGGRFNYTGRKGQAVSGRQRIVRGFVFFLQTAKNGHSIIFGRRADESVSRDIIPFYVLVPEAHIMKSGLDMASTVQRTAEAEFGKQFEQQFRKVYATGLRI